MNGETMEFDKEERDLSMSNDTRPALESAKDLRSSAISLPKIGALAGSIHLEWKRCGQTNCRCREGQLHGPYYTRHWREGGRQRKQYVPAKDVVATLLAIEAHREAFPTASGMIAAIESAITAPRKPGEWS